VHNPGPYDVRVRWTVYNYARQPMTYAGQTDDAEPWVTAGLRVKHGRVRVTLDLFAYEATDANDQQYTVEPAEVVVKAGQPAAFKVAFRSMQPGRFCSFLRGEQMIMHDECEPVTFKMWERLPRGYESSSDEGESDAEEQVAVEAATARVEDGAGAGEGAEEQRAGNASASETGQGEGNAGRHEEGDGEELIGGSDTMPAYRTEDLATMNPDDIGTLTSTGRRRRSGGERGERGPRPQPRYTLGELAAADKDVLLRGCFHPFAAAPRVPMTRLHVNLEALSLRPHLEPDDRKQMTSVLHACNPLSHSQYHRHVTLTNLYATPLTFMLACKRPWKIAAQEPSVPQKPPLIEPLHTPHGFAKQVRALTLYGRSHTHTQHSATARPPQPPQRTSTHTHSLSMRARCPPHSSSISTCRTGAHATTARVRGRAPRLRARGGVPGMRPCGAGGPALHLQPCGHLRAAGRGAAAAAVCGLRVPHAHRGRTQEEHGEPVDAQLHGVRPGARARTAHHEGGAEQPQPGHVLLEGGGRRQSTRFHRVSRSRNPRGPRAGLCQDAGSGGDVPAAGGAAVRARHRVCVQARSTLCDPGGGRGHGGRDDGDGAGPPTRMELRWQHVALRLATTSFT
jgi:hypothetical protein